MRTFHKPAQAVSQRPCILADVRGELQTKKPVINGLLREMQDSNLRSNRA